MSSAPDVDRALGVTIVYTRSSVMGSKAHVFAVDGVRYFVVARPLAEDAAPLPPLTAAQRDVLRLLALDLSNQEIAVRRRSSPRTVANQVATLLRVLRCGNRSELALIARRAALPSRFVRVT